jgi:hypothetical protein
MMPLFPNTRGWTRGGTLLQRFLFLQFATKEDVLTPARVEELKFYEAHHALKAEARRDRIAFRSSDSI